MIVPTRGRPNNAIALYNTWVKTARGTADLLFAVDNDDPQLPTYRAAAAVMPETMLRIAPRRRLVGTLNAAATEWATDYRCLGFMGDDHRPRSEDWDWRFTECLSGGTGIVYGNDLLQGEAMPTAVAMTSDIVATLGYMVPPQLVHLCVDLVWKDWGTRLGRITYLPDVIIEHMHPAAGKAVMDAGYTDANSAQRVAQDSAAYYEYRNNGGLDADVAKLKALIE